MYVHYMETVTLERNCYCFRYYSVLCKIILIIITFISVIYESFYVF